MANPEHFEILEEGSSSGTGGGTKIRAWCYIRARSHAYAERRFCARRVARAKQKLAHREAERNGGFGGPKSCRAPSGAAQMLCCVAG